MKSKKERNLLHRKKGDIILKMYVFWEHKEKDRKSYKYEEF